MLHTSVQLSPGVRHHQSLMVCGFLTAVMGVQRFLQQIPAEAELGWGSDCIRLFLEGTSETQS